MYIPVDADRLALLLKKRKIGSVQLANKLGIEKGSIAALVRGDKKSVKLETFQLICAGLNTTPAHLIGKHKIALLAYKAGQKALPAPKDNIVSKTRHSSGRGLKIIGECHVDNWKGANFTPDYPDTMPISPDARYAQMQQSAYIVKPTDPSHAIIAIAIDPKEFSKKASPRKISDGSMVVAQRKNDNLTETCLALIHDQGKSFTVLQPDPSGNNIVQPVDPVRQTGLTVVAYVPSVIRLNY